MFNDRSKGYKKSVDSKRNLLNAGIQAAEEKGINAFTSLDIYAFINIKIEVKSAVWHHYKTMKEFRAVVRDEAIRTGNFRLIVQIASLNPPIPGDLTLSRSLILQSLERLKEFISDE